MYSSILFLVHPFFHSFIPDSFILSHASVSIKLVFFRYIGCLTLANLLKPPLFLFARFITFHVK